MLEDRFFYSRAEGHYPALLYSLSEETKAQAETPYGARLFQALTGRVYVKGAPLARRLPLVGEHPEQEAAKERLERRLGALRKAIPIHTRALLDLPEVARDPLERSIAIYEKRFAAILGDTCYLIKDFAKDNNHEITTLFSATAHSGHPMAVAWLSSSAVLLATRRSHDLLLLDSTNPRTITCLRQPMRTRIAQLARISDAEFFAGCTNGALVYNDVKKRTAKVVAQLAHQVCALVVSPDAQKVAVGTTEGRFYLYRLTADKAVELLGSYSGLRAFTWLSSSYGFVLAGGVGNSTLSVYSLGAAEPKAIHKVAGRVQNIVYTAQNQIAVTHDGTLSHFYLANTQIHHLYSSTLKANDQFLDAIYNDKVGLVVSTTGEQLQAFKPLKSYL